MNEGRDEVTEPVRSNSAAMSRRVLVAMRATVPVVVGEVSCGPGSEQIVHPDRNLLSRRATGRVGVDAGSVCGRPDVRAGAVAEGVRIDVDKAVRIVR